jgi:hypothetical protein
MSHIEYPDVVQLDTRDMAGGCPMQTVPSPSKVERGGTEVHEEATPSRLTTTLYDLITAIQEVVGAEDAALAVATVGHLLQSGRFTWRGKA